MDIFLRLNVAVDALVRDESGIWRFRRISAGTIVKNREPRAASLLVRVVSEDGECIVRSGQLQESAELVKV